MTSLKFRESWLFNMILKKLSLEELLLAGDILQSKTLPSAQNVENNKF